MEQWDSEIGKLEVEYIPGTDSDFVVFVQSQGEKAQLKTTDGHFRWVVERENGTKYIARPNSAR